MSGRPDTQQPRGTREPHGGSGRQKPGRRTRSIHADERNGGSTLPCPLGLSPDLCLYHHLAKNQLDIEPIKLSVPYRPRSFSCTTSQHARSQHTRRKDPRKRADRQTDRQTDRQCPEKGGNTVILKERSASCLLHRCGVAGVGRMTAGSGLQAFLAECWRPLMIDVDFKGGGFSLSSSLYGINSCKYL